jgi:excisionase family DNA binding protein
MPEAITDRLLYSITDAAKLLDMSPEWLRREHTAGRIVFTRAGRRIKIHRDELESYARNLPKD